MCFIVLVDGYKYCNHELRSGNRFLLETMSGVLRCFNKKNWKTDAVIVIVGYDKLRSMQFISSCDIIWIGFQKTAQCMEPERQVFTLSCHSQLQSFRYG